VQPEQAQAIIDKFKIAYAKMGNPRMLIYINRDLVDENTGVRLIARTEKGNISRTQSKSDGPSQKGGRMVEARASMGVLVEVDRDRARAKRRKRLTRIDIATMTGKNSRWQTARRPGTSNASSADRFEWPEPASRPASSHANDDGSSIQNR